MGLCKCPKRKVTNQFCFEHRVNVCEHCMVKKHPKVSSLKLAINYMRFQKYPLNWKVFVNKSNLLSFQCVVQSYLQWLQDSDYNPNCSLCDQDLAEESCVRLNCYCKNCLTYCCHWKWLLRVRLVPKILASEYKILFQVYFTGYAWIVTAETFRQILLQLVILVQNVKIVFFLQRISFLLLQVI